MCESFDPKPWILPQACLKNKKLTIFFSPMPQALVSLCQKKIPYNKCLPQ